MMSWKEFMKIVTLVTTKLYGDLVFELDAMNVLKVYEDILQDKKGNKLWLLTLLQVNQSYTMSKILVDQTAIR